MTPQRGRARQAPPGVVVACVIVACAAPNGAAAVLPHTYPEEQIVHYEWDYRGGRAFVLGITPNGAVAFGRYDGRARYFCLSRRQRHRLAALRGRLRGLPDSTEGRPLFGTNSQELAVGTFGAIREHSADEGDPRPSPSAVRRLLEHLHRLVRAHRGSARAVPDEPGPYTPLCLASEAQRRRQPAIVEGHGIAAIEIGMTTRDVRRRLGRPDSIDRDPPRSPSRDVPLVAYRYERERIEVAFDATDRFVWRVRTRNPRHRTRSGLGLGSTESAVRRRSRGESCKVDDGRGLCLVDGGRVMSFRLAGGRVRHVSVSQVLRGF